MSTVFNSENRATRIAMHVIAWILLSLLGFSVVQNFFPFRVAVMHMLLSSAALCVMFYVNNSLVNRYLERGDVVRYVISAILLFVVTSVIRLEINNYLVPDDLVVVFKPENHQIKFMILAISSTVLFLLGSIFYQLIVNRYRNEREAMRLITEQQEAQLDFLKAQINPHFLFNALHNIYSLTVVKSNEAPKMLLQLSDLLRYVIYEGRQKTVSLEREVAFIHKFIELFRMRSEEPLHITFEVTGDLAGRSIEPMILIPLVENCFKHCDFLLNPAAFIHLRLRADGRTLHFETHNSRNIHDHQKDTVGGVGLENIRRRLALHYPDRHTLATTATATDYRLRLTLIAA